MLTSRFLDGNDNLQLVAILRTVLKVNIQYAFKQTTQRMHAGA